jgi:NADH:ubiquinone oxidoreductase subunit 3 (subunit A)
VSTYVGAVAALLVASAVVGGVYVVHRAWAVSAEPLTVLPYLSGWLPSEHALSRFHARWYPATLLFLAFDVEMLFMYPWAVVVAEMGAAAVIEMFLFLAVLMGGVVWAWREGALRWV